MVKKLDAKKEALDKREQALEKQRDKSGDDKDKAKNDVAKKISQAKIAAANEIAAQKKASD